MSKRLAIDFDDELHALVTEAAENMRWSVTTFIRTACIEKLRRDEATGVSKTTKPSRTTSRPPSSYTPPDASSSVPRATATFTEAQLRKHYDSHPEVNGAMTWESFLSLNS